MPLARYAAAADRPGPGWPRLTDVCSENMSYLRNLQALWRAKNTWISLRLRVEGYRAQGRLGAVPVRRLHCIARQCLPAGGALLLWNKELLARMHLALEPSNTCFSGVPHAQAVSPISVSVFVHATHEKSRTKTAWAGQQSAAALDAAAGHAFRSRQQWPCRRNRCSCCSARPHTCGRCRCRTRQIQSADGSFALCSGRSS